MGSQAPSHSGIQHVVPFSVLTGRRYARDTIVIVLMPRLAPTATATATMAGEPAWAARFWKDVTGYSVTQGRSSTNGYSGSAGANWQATYGTLGVGYNYDRDHRDYNWQLPAAWSSCGWHYV